MNSWIPLNPNLVYNWYDVRNFLETNTLLIFGFILLIALTSLICFKSGIINIALEGQFIMGVFGFVLFGSFVKKSGLNIYSKTFISIIGAFVFLTIITFIFSFLTITLKINQILVGIGLNIIASAVSLFFTLMITDDVAFRDLHFDTFYSVEAKLIYQNIINLKNQSIDLFLPLLILIFIVPFVWFFIEKTTIGFRIRATGKDLKMSKTIGIKSEKYQYIAVMSGVFLMTIASWFFAEWNHKFSGNVFGFGYLGLSLVILGREKVWSITIFTLLISTLILFTSKITKLEPNPNIIIDPKKREEFKKFYNSLEDIFNASIYLIPILSLVIYESIKKLKKFRLKKNF